MDGGGRGVIICGWRNVSVRGPCCRLFQQSCRNWAGHLPDPWTSHTPHTNTHNLTGTPSWVRQHHTTLHKQLTGTPSWVCCWQSSSPLAGCLCSTSAGQAGGCWGGVWEWGLGIGGSSPAIPSHAFIAPRTPPHLSAHKRVEGGWGMWGGHNSPDIHSAKLHIAHTLSSSLK